mmetsp:Transcript_2882/g.8486  ORF Transcript_2882/g.8486 Transcript_2882/m.8486 type:complete len:249 (+) Transcript_2882:623-1369(+)
MTPSAASKWRSCSPTRPISRFTRTTSKRLAGPTPNTPRMSSRTPPPSTPSASSSSPSHLLGSPSPSLSSSLARPTRSRRSPPQPPPQSPTQTTTHMTTRRLRSGAGCAVRSKRWATTPDSSELPRWLSGRRSRTSNRHLHPAISSRSARQLSRPHQTRPNSAARPILTLGLEATCRPPHSACRRKKSTIPLASAPPPPLRRPRAPPRPHPRRKRPTSSTSETTPHPHRSWRRRPLVMKASRSSTCSAA